MYVTRKFNPLTRIMGPIYVPLHKTFRSGDTGKTGVSPTHERTKPEMPEWIQERS